VYYFCCKFNVLLVMLFRIVGYRMEEDPEADWDAVSSLELRECEGYNGRAHWVNVDVFAVGNMQSIAP
jgi:hypothetical protein